MTDLELYHYGVKGQKWGIRRYQNKDGSLTDAGKTRIKLSDTLMTRKTAQSDAEWSARFRRRESRRGNRVYLSKAARDSKRIAKLSKDLDEAISKKDYKKRAEIERVIESYVQSMNANSKKAKEFAERYAIEDRLVKDISDGVAIAGKDYAVGYGRTKTYAFIIVDPDSSTLSYARDYHNTY